MNRDTRQKPETPGTPRPWLYVSTSLEVEQQQWPSAGLEDVYWKTERVEAPAPAHTPVQLQRAPGYKHNATRLKYITKRVPMYRVTPIVYAWLSCKVAKLDRAYLERKHAGDSPDALDKLANACCETAQRWERIKKWAAQNLDKAACEAAEREAVQGRVKLPPAPCAVELLEMMDRMEGCA